jgi:lysophospholipase L1-like esterase
MPPSQRNRRLRKLALALCSVGLGAWAGAQAQPLGQRVALRASPATDPRWQDSFDAFAAADRVTAPQPGGVVFVGSSSIRLWDGLEAQFGDQPVLKRGFGGSRMLDVAEQVERLVLPYQPRLIVVYAGDNDLAEGRTPQQVLDSFVAFVVRVRSALPGARIAYLSIKPSPSRAALMPQAVQANGLIAAYSASVPNLAFIDIYRAMLDATGQPRADLYGDDLLHLNAAGYALWTAALAPHLRPPAPPPASELSAAAQPRQPAR